MAYSIKPTYEPMTFQEMLQPYAVYGAERDRQEEAYMKLLEDARSLEDLRDSDVDKEEYNKYIDFKNRINSMVDEIATTGLSRQTMSNLSKYRAEYQADFANMVDRIKRRGELVRQQREYLAKAPNTFFDVDYSNTPASKVVDGSSYTPYNMDEAAKKSASDMYSLYTSKGNDITEDDIAAVADNIRASYNYDSLDDNKKAMVDSAITSGAMTAHKAYSDALYKNALDQAKLAKAQADAYKSAYGRYKATGERVNRGGGGSSGGSVVSGATGATGYSGKFEKHLFGLENRPAVLMTPAKDASGNNVYQYKGIDGKVYTISEEDYDKQFNIEDNTVTLNSEFEKRIYGGIHETRRLFGNDVTVFRGDDGSVVKVINNKGNIIDTKGSSMVDIYKAYTGKDKLPKVMTLSDSSYEKLYSINGKEFVKPYKFEGTRHEYIESELNGEIIDQDIIKSYDDYDKTVGKFDSSSKYSSALRQLKDFVKNITGAQNEDDFMEKLKEVFNLGYHVEVTFYGNPHNGKYKQFRIMLHRDENDAVADNGSGDNRRQQQNSQQQQQQQQQSTDSTSTGSNNTAATQVDTTETFSGDVNIE